MMAPLPEPAQAVVSSAQTLPMSLVERKIAALEQSIEHLYELVPFGSHCLAADGTYASINARELAWLGRRREDLIGKRRPADFLSTESRARLNTEVAVCPPDGFTDLELELVNPEGERRLVAMSTRRRHDAGGKPLAYRAVSFDLTEEKARLEQARIAALAFESLAGICVTDGVGVVLQVNKAFTAITGYAPADVVGHSAELFIEAESHRDNSSGSTAGQALSKRVLMALKKVGQWQGEITDRHRDGRPLVGWLTVSAVHGDLGDVNEALAPTSEQGQRVRAVLPPPVNYVASLYDITASKATQEEVNQLAYFDALTKLPNRRLLQDRLNRAIALMPRSGLRGAVLFIDLDNFKTLNDTRGHAAGDQLLIQVAKRLRHALREGDTVARLGGDEFVVLLNHQSAHLAQATLQVQRIAKKVLKALSMPYWLGETEFNCSASIGVSMFGGGEKGADLLQQSDLAMYQAKKAGRNTVTFFDPGMQEAVNLQAALEQELSRALRLQQFELHYQAQVNAKGQVLGAEVLLRWRHPRLGLVSPSEFMVAAEENGTILGIGQWVLEMACQQIQIWANRPETARLNLSVNVSPRQLQQADFVSQVLSAVRVAGINPARLKLELTESAVHDIADTRAKMAELGAQGIRFSMDDFGTGYSSLSSLTKLPLSQLKIDQSFIRRMETSVPDAIVVRTIIGMAQSLALEAIAEGVETDSERLFLEACGCQLYQGFLFGRPVPVQEFEAQLKASSP